MANPNWFAMRAIVFFDAICILFTNEVQNECFTIWRRKYFCESKLFLAESLSFITRR
jgi:hypothetical protein